MAAKKKKSNRGTDIPDPGSELKRATEMVSARRKRAKRIEKGKRGNPDSSIMNSELFRERELRFPPFRVGDPRNPKRKFRTDPTPAPAKDGRGKGKYDEKRKK